jgi:hypothetical protein
MRRKQWLAAALILAATVGLAATRAWPFNSSPGPLPNKPSLAQLFLADRLTLGFVRLAIVLLTLFVIASVPALVVAGRWIKGFGTTGLPVDDAGEASEGIASLKEQVVALKAERDGYKNAAAQSERIASDAVARLEERRRGTSRPRSSEGLDS